MINGEVHLTWIRRERRWELELRLDKQSEQPDLRIVGYDPKAMLQVSALPFIAEQMGEK